MNPSQEILLPFAKGVDAQPDALRLTYRNACRWFEAFPVHALRGRRLLFLGIGASHALLATTVYRLRGDGVDALRSDGDSLPPGSPVMADWYIGVSQSGRSPEVTRAIRYQPERGRRLSVVNQTDSPLENECGAAFCLGALADSGMSSVALMSTALFLGMLGDVVIGGQTDALWPEMPQRLTALRPLAQPVAAGFAARLKEIGCVDFIARGSSLTAAEQGALFLREGPKIPAMASATRGYLHGMTDAVGNTAHVIIGGAREVLLAKQLAEFGVPILLITDVPQDNPSGVDTLYIPPMTAGPRALLELLVMEILSLELAAVWGRDIDAGVVGRIDTKLGEGALLPGADLT